MHLLFCINAKHGQIVFVICARYEMGIEAAILLIIFFPFRYSLLTRKFLLTMHEVHNYLKQGPHLHAYQND